MNVDKNLCRILDENWLKAEKHAQDFLNISRGYVDQYDTNSLEILLRKACAMVGTECFRRMQKRLDHQALSN